MINHHHQQPARRGQRVFIIPIVLVIGLLLWGIRWATFARPPLPEANAALTGDDLVKVTQEPWLSFIPTETKQVTGFIFYPGGRIDPQGYAPLMKTIAAEGYLVVLPEMPINMAAFQPNIADEIIVHYPDIRHWVIGGHSIGGTMAAQYTHTHRETIDGLVIWASYPANNSDLSTFERPIALIYGSNDPRVNDSSVAERQYLLPEKTRYVRIAGGDHHQFGSYEIDPENHHATISRTSQQNQIIQATLEVLTVASKLE